MFVTLRNLESATTCFLVEFYFAANFSNICFSCLTIYIVAMNHTVPSLVVNIHVTVAAHLPYTHHIGSALQLVFACLFSVIVVKQSETGYDLYKSKYLFSGIQSHTSSCQTKGQGVTSYVQGKFARMLNVLQSVYSHVHPRRGQHRPYRLISGRLDRQCVEVIAQAQQNREPFTCNINDVSFALQCQLFCFTSRKMKWYTCAYTVPSIGSWYL